MYKEKQTNNQKGVLMKKSTLRSLFLIAAIIYIISPLDATPGPIDDFLVLLLSLVARNGLLEKEEPIETYYYEEVE